MDTKKLYDDYMITSMVAGFQPVQVEKASGCVVTGHDGKEFIDLFSGIAVCNAGHGHPDVVQAAKEQMDKLIHCCTYVYYNPRAGELAQKLAEITPGKLKKSFLANSGAEAIEGAIRLAKQHTGKKEIIALTHSFHGRTYATLSITGNWSRKKGGGPYMPGVSFAPAPYCYRCPFGYSGPEKCGLQCAKHVEHIIKYHTYGDVAAFIAEPLLGEGGIIAPPEGYFETVKEILDANGILFICDEVQSGFGRTGKMFGVDHYNVDVDIMTMAKGIADGFPISAFTAREDIAQAFTPGDHLSTFGGNPVSCAAALSNIKVMENEKLPDASAERGRELRERFNSIKARNSLIGDVRGKGLMIGIELVKDDAKTPASDEAKAVRTKCNENGVLIGVGGVHQNVVRIQPPLNLSAGEASKAGDIIAEAIAQVS
ncbi:MAG: aspartate aminotransferase family protein [Verrucomicrobiota bacterium]